MTNIEKNECHIVIHDASGAAACIAGGNILPVADAFPLTGIQMVMINRIGEIFDKTLTESLAQTIRESFAAMFLGRGISQMLASFIPGIGNVINALTAAALTEYIGWSVAEKFDKERGKVMYAVNS